ncbi:MAG: hypothetical protein D3916_15540, partial [Candidatus Electrothrix sp. MAN1_4]|nr:hypothetical protein [Candidatus Electrothrix sp. MAN1_4]
MFFLASCGMILHFVAQQQDMVDIEDGSALVLAPYGSILEKNSSLDPLENFLHLLDGSGQEEFLVQDIIDGIQRAAHDDRIQLLVLVPDRLEQAGLNQLQDIGRAIDAFKKSGKSVIAYADSFTQGQYAFAVRSNE